MSYLWILLLGSLLATSAKAQDDAEPTAEALETTEPTPEEVTTEYEEEATAEEEHEHSSEEVSPTEAESETTEDPDPTADPETTEATTEAEEVTTAEEDAVTEAGEEEEAETTVAADVEEETAATTAAPAADPETQEPEAEQPASKEEDEDEPAKTNTTAPPPKKAAADPDAEDSDEEPTNPVVPVPTIKPNVAAPEVKEGFDLEDALEEGPAVVNPAQPGKSRSLDPGPHAAGATGDVDKPDGQESGSSSLAGILSAVVIAAVGGVAAYITYQKKMLCFKNRQEADPEAARKADAAEAQSDPQVLSNLLNSS